MENQLLCKRSLNVGRHLFWAALRCVSLIFGIGGFLSSYLLADSFAIEN
jgi:hypothetical protein